MRNREKVMFFVFTLCICASLCAGTEAQAKIKRGKWKDNISWSYDTNKKELVLTGKGAIAEDYETEDDLDFPGWILFSDEVKTLKISGRITRISDTLAGESSFKRLKKLELCNSIKVIGRFAFSGTYKLKNVKMKEGLEKIQENAFSFSGLHKVTIPGSVKKMGSGVFMGCQKLKKVTFSEGITKTGKSTCWVCGSLKNVELPQTLKVVEKRCFLGAGLAAITIPENVEEIGDLSTSSFLFLVDQRSLLVAITS